jgi:diguanylate cyclase (GGDEF)-like protein
MLHNVLIFVLIAGATATIVGLYARLWRKLRHRAREVDEINRQREQLLIQAKQRTQDIELLKQQSIADPLTGLKTRSYFLEALRTEWKRATRNGQSFSVLMVELDGLERLAALGETEIERLVARAGRLLQEKSRHSNVVARYGDTRFIVLLPDAELEPARMSADRLRVWMENDPVLRTAQVTGSFGVAAHPVHGTTEEALLAVAEAGILTAKAHGGNRVETESSPKP